MTDAPADPVPTGEPQLAGPAPSGEPHHVLAGPAPSGEPQLVLAGPVLNGEHSPAPAGHLPTEERRSAPLRVALLGSGRLRDAIASALPQPPVSNHAPSTGAQLSDAPLMGAPLTEAAYDIGTPDVLVTAHDADDTRHYQRVYRQAVAARIPWLPVRTDTGWVLIGPAARPPRPGCPLCAERRRASNRADARARRALREQYGQELVARPCALVTPLLAAAVGALVAAEADRLHRDPASARTDRALLRISIETGLLTRHPLLPDPLCPECADLPEDRPRVPALGPSPKSDPYVFRLRSLTRRQTELERLYVDAETGLIQSLATGTARGSATAVAHLRPAIARHDSNHGYGRSRDFASARLTAMAEALERHAGLRPRGRRTVVHAPYAEVADHALDPRTLGLYPDDWYGRPDFPFVRFDQVRPTAWVWGYSFARAEPLLIPESYAYYGPRPEGDLGFAYECSNGCAIGGCLAEAVFHGLLEVAERDAFLTTWYTRLPAPRVDLDSAADRSIPMTAARIRHDLGYEVMVFDMTLEQGVPAFWTMAVDRVGGPGRPYTMCGAAAHPDPEHALASALAELGPGIEGLTRRYDAERAACLLAAPDRVREMDDHALLYGHPDAFGRLAFLPADGPRLPIAGKTWPARDLLPTYGPHLSIARKTWPARDEPHVDVPRPPITGRTWPARDDLAGDLAELVGRYLATGLDVIAVDTTGSEQRAGGFACAKVLVPGTASMTFGHRFRRTHGLPRLLSLPRLLGHRERDLCPGELNPDPHPFP
ncbi:TOMM precursor leader peptide-binding protein [Nonomuraea sp. CA-143628]|uniref:TOMM precursor leader peptide-binding protein n=1 Tax=Nonomuraea sp. CA-143628 TaxID=3239997 RepID=UPI003D8DB638